MKYEKSLAEFIRKKFERVELYEENLWQYQTDGFNFLYKNPFSALFMDTGLGKTATLLLLIWELYLRRECKNVLIVGPPRVVNVTWPDEIANWNFSAGLTYNIIKDETLIDRVNKAGQFARRNAKAAGHSDKVVKAMVEDARSKEAAKAVREMMIDRPANIHLIHKEAVAFLVDAFGKDWPFDVVIVDESSCLKDHTTNRWKAFWRVRKLIKRFHQLTATPAAEGYIHLFGQITLLDLGFRLGTKVTHFRERYFKQNRYSMKWEALPGAVEEISEKISDICLVMKQEDYLDLEQPKVVHQKVRLDDIQLKLYNEMMNKSIVELGEPGSEIEVEAQSASELSQKLAQMASGVLYQTVLEPVNDEEFRRRRVVHHLHDHKIEKLRQLQEEVNGENLLVAYYHQSSLQRLLEAFPEAKAMDKEGKLIKEWNKGKIKMLLMHPQSDAHGLNLQKGGRHVVFFDLIWSYENYYQFYRRLARQGQKLLVLIHQLICEGTIDEIMSESLDNKRDGQEVMFTWITNLRRRILRAQQKELAHKMDFDDI